MRSSGSGWPASPVAAERPSRLGLQPLLFFGLAGLLTVAGLIAAVVVVYALDDDAARRDAHIERVKGWARWTQATCRRATPCADVIEATFADEPDLRLIRVASLKDEGGAVALDVLNGRALATQRLKTHHLVAAAVIIDGRRHALLSALDLRPQAARTRHRIWAVLGLMAINFTLVLLFGLYLSGRLITRPLKRLTAGAEAGAIPRLGGPREIYTLSRAFAALFERLAAQNAALEAQNKALEAARVTLARSEALASVGRLAAGVAHEIGNPLSAVIGYVEYLKDERGVTPELRAGLLARMDASLERMRQTLRQLLDFSRPAPAAPIAFAPRVVLDEALALLRYQPKVKGLSLEIEGEAGWAYAPPETLRQALINLTLNAADAMEGQGRLRFTLGREGGEITLSVEDDGPGIDEAHAARLFEPFFTTKPVGQGTGLGLAISQRLIEEAGGGLRLTSTRPTRFEIRLPACDAPK